ncbi:MAG: 50S ribosomal protein L5 [Patescibacteria group bacterium]|nr:50S ribosomal protein L5 [Patescibacteria group bacterium]
MARLKELYDKKLKKELGEKLVIENTMALPRVEKVVVNAGIGKATQDSKYLTEAEEALLAITGQKPIPTKAKKSIAGFKLREGNPVGVSVTLRGVVMYEFLDRLINVALPRIRDFRGIKSTAFDPKGNYSIGIKEHTVFPELIGKEVEPISLQVNIKVAAKNKEESQALLQALGFPFVKEDNA